MKTFVTSDIEIFLRAIDKHLSRPFKIVIIGGAAAALAYRVVDYTKDIDTLTALEPIEEACAKAKRETGLEIPIGPAGVADFPWSYEERLQRLEITGIRRLAIFVPEIHDLALMKIMRANENDIKTIQQMNAAFGLDHALLLNRYMTEMTHVIGNRKTIRLNLLATLEAVFGKAIAEAAEKRI